MKQFHTFGGLVQAAGIVTALVLLATGVAFAALQSQPGVLKGNTIQTAVASLQVSQNGSTYSSSVDGYTFSNLIPGGQPMPASGYSIFVKNVGTTPLALKLSVKPAVGNPQNVDLSKVRLILTPTPNGTPQSLTLQELISADSTGGLTIDQAGHIIPSQVLSYTMRIALDSDAITGPSAMLSNIDFSFGAVAVN